MSDQKFGVGTAVTDGERQQQSIMKQYLAIEQNRMRLLDEGQRVFNRWCARRRNDIEDYLALNRDVLQAREPLGVLLAWSRWSQARVANLAGDTRDQFEFGATWQVFNWALEAPQFSDSPKAVSDNVTADAGHGAAAKRDGPTSRPQKGSGRSG